MVKPITFRRAANAAGFVDMDIEIVVALSVVATAMEKANYRNLGHAAASLRKRAIGSIKQAEGPSPRGTPPHTRRRSLPRAIVYKVDDHGAIIGPRHSRFSDAAQYHEFGGIRRGKDYIATDLPPRPFMGPALEDASGRFAAEWSNSIGAP